MNPFKLLTPFEATDAYKISHWIQYPEEVDYIYSNFTPRYNLRPGIDKFVFFGLQYFLQRLTDLFEDFFQGTDEEAVDNFAEFYRDFFKSSPTDKHLRCVQSLHDLGYIPLRFGALPEGSIVPNGVPVVTIENTVKGFHWLVGWVESWLSCEIWHPCTSATTAMYYRIQFDKYAKETSDLAFMPDFQGHDFSFRGMECLEAAMKSGAGHLLSFKGTDTCPAVRWVKHYYSGSPDDELIGTSVPATEHSVASASILINGHGEASLEAEVEMVRRLLKLYPTGILSYVSDTFNFWRFVCQGLPLLKDEIMARDGKFVVRPDSGDPVKIICGDPEANPYSYEFRGLIKMLYETFGGTDNSKGYCELDSHIGAIYGDSITLERQSQILSGLEAKGFSSTNIVLGIGSFTYQYVTRDTHGLAMKTTAIGLTDGTYQSIYKDPATDTSGKKSARGFLAVLWNGKGDELCLKQGVDFEERYLAEIEPVWEDSNFLFTQSFSEVRENLTWYKKVMGLG